MMMSLTNEVTILPNADGEVDDVAAHRELFELF
jgi:hypothetical protein